MGKLSAIIVFLLTFFAYVALHGMREGWSYSKPQLRSAFDVPQTYFGTVDTLYLISYSLGMATIGNLSGKVPLNYFIAVGMIFSALSFMSFTFFYQSTHQFSYAMVTVFMCLNGFFQSTGCPGVTAAMGNWFGKGRRGLLMGFWGINGNIGNIVASILCGILQNQLNLSWTANFISLGCLCIFVGILVMLFLNQKPKKLRQEQQQINQTNIETIQEDEDLQESMVTADNRDKEKRSEESIQKKKLNVFTALCIPRVPFYVVAYSCMKGCMYGLLFWLPTYLQDKNLHYQKGYIASMVDVGTFIGSLIVGFLGDKYGYRALFLSPSFFLGAIIMFIVSFSFTDIAWMYYVAMLLIGLTAGGPHNIIGSAITIDLGEQAGKQNIAKVSALIEGCAAIFAALSQLLIAAIPFNAIFYLFSGECILAGLVLVPLFLKDFTAWKKR